MVLKIVFITFFFVSIYYTLIVLLILRYSNFLNVLCVYGIILYLPLTMLSKNTYSFMEVISTTNCFDTNTQCITSRHLTKITCYIMTWLYVREIACQLTVANFTDILAVPKFHSMFIHVRVRFQETRTKQRGQSFLFKEITGVPSWV